MKYDQKASSALIKVLRKCGEQQIDVHIIYRLPIHPFVREHPLYISFALCQVATQLLSLS